MGISHVGVVVDGFAQTSGAIGSPDDLWTINGISAAAAREVLHYGLSKRPGWLHFRFEDTRGLLHPLVLGSSGEVPQGDGAQGKGEGEGFPLFFGPTLSAAYQRVENFAQLSNGVAAMRDYENTRNSERDWWFAERYTEVWFPQVSSLVAVVLHAHKLRRRDLQELQALRRDHAEAILKRHPGLVIASFTSEEGFLAVTQFRPPAQGGSSSRGSVAPAVDVSCSSSSR